ncbi:IS1595 family transposase [Pararhizobium sp. IMCC21322]|uniref:IS1595 family transposase n=1 Tax=Pararhizobium sp. IMCC21322 TaxID=3067903 RepID=UPI002740C4ED|nr:IS1595 family transposase [Pararhizobium sp. IMCC21322]
MSVLAKAHFYDEKAAFEHVESILWPDGPVCPHCGCVERIYKLEGVRTKPSKKNPDGIERFGLKKCGDCRKQFTVRKGTIFEESAIPLHKWLQAIHLMCSSKKGIFSNQLHRTLEITLKSAWFLSHRIREAMRNDDFTPLGGAGGIVEIDETFTGKRDAHRGAKLDKRGGVWWKVPVLTLIDRKGTARSFVIDRATKANVLPILRENLDKEARVITDDSSIYRELDREYMHAFVVHSRGEYGRGEITTNTVEGFFSIFKRGMKGVYQHCSEKHLHRYMAEYDFRYSNREKLGCDDKERAKRALLSIVGRRLTYEGPAYQS